MLSLKLFQQIQSFSKTRSEIIFDLNLTIIYLPTFFLCVCVFWQASQANLVVDYKDWQIPLGRRFRLHLKFSTGTIWHIYIQYSETLCVF